MQAFEDDEYRARIERVLSAMGKRGIEVLLVTNPANAFYLCGYDAESYYTKQALIVSGELAEPLWIVRNMDVVCAEASAFLAPENVIGYPEAALGGGEASFVVDILRSRGIDRRAMAVEKDDCYFSAALFADLCRLLPDARFADATGLVNWVRTVKSPAEVALMRQAGQISTLAIAAGLEVIRPGVRQCDAVATIAAQMLRGTEEFGGAWPAHVVFMAAGEDGTIHMPFSDEAFQRDQAVSFELGASRHRYHSPMNRTIYLGAPPAPLQRLSDAVIEAMERTLERIEPGVLCEDLEREWRSVMAGAGYVKEARIGYAVGTGFPPGWAENTFSIRSGDRTLLEPNMTFHFNLGMWEKGCNYSISETILVTETGHESLTPYPRRLFTAVARGTA